MVELTINEYMDIEGGATVSTVITGAGVTLIGVACMVAAPSVAVAAAGYLLYNGGAICMILGACEV